MNIVVAGASGFLGTALCARLEDAGHSTDRLDSKNCDLTIQGSLNRYSANTYDIIYHLAAWTQAGDFCLHHQGEQWIINQQINTNMLTWWRESQPQAKLISMGSSCSYDPSLELREENYLAGTPIESLYAYAMAKRMLHIGQLSIHRQFELPFLTVVPSTLYGPGYHTDNRQMHFVFDLIRKILHARRFGSTPVLWGDGHQRRELIFIDDFIDALLHISQTCTNDIVNIGCGQDYAICEIAEHICALVDYDAARIEYDTSRYVGARSKKLEIDKLRALQPDFKPVSLDEGLRSTITWFEAHADALLAK